METLAPLQPMLDIKAFLDCQYEIVPLGDENDMKDPSEFEPLAQAAVVDEKPAVQETRTVGGLPIGVAVNSGSPLNGGSSSPQRSSVGGSGM